MRAGKIRVVIIGCGQIAGGYDKPRGSRGKIRTHIKAYRSDPRFEVTAVYDRLRSHAERFRRRWGIPQAYTSLREMLRKERPHVVSVCTPTRTHAKVLTEVARHPVKLVFAEKPFTNSPAQARKLVALFKRKRISVAVNYLRRWCPNHRAIKAIIDSGRLGALRCVDAYYSGDLLNIGSHLVDLIQFLGGEVMSVGAGGQLRIKNIPGVIQRGRKDDFILELLFDRGMVKIEKYGYAGRCVIWSKQRGSVGLKTLFAFRPPNRGIDSALKLAVGNIGDHLLRGKKLASNPTNALKTLAICSALAKAD